jgi:hypothetical protein
MFDALSAGADGNIKRLEDCSILAKTQPLVAKGQPNQPLI